jgi:putative aldouronate transport system substrate-binding protein
MHLDYDYEVHDQTAVTGAFPTGRYNPGAFDFNLTRYPGVDLRSLSRTEELAKMDQQALNPLQRLAFNDPTGLLLLNAQSIKVAFEGEQYNIYDDYIWPLPGEAAALKESLDTMENDVYSGIITGKRPLENWDDFVTDWLSQGGERLTKIVNDDDARHR